MSCQQITGHGKETRLQDDLCQFDINNFYIIATCILHRRLNWIETQKRYFPNPNLTQNKMQLFFMQYIQFDWEKN